MSTQPVSLVTEPQQRGKDMAAKLREMADKAEKGVIADLIVVAHIRDKKCYWSAGYFEDKWRLLGALEYVKGEVVNS